MAFSPSETYPKVVIRQSHAPASGRYHQMRPVRALRASPATRLRTGRDPFRSADGGRSRAGRGRGRGGRGGEVLGGGSLTDWLDQLEEAVLQAGGAVTGEVGERARVPQRALHDH